MEQNDHATKHDKQHAHELPTADRVGIEGRAKPDLDVAPLECT